MSIRKTAAAGEVLGVEQQPALAKTAAADPGWREDDEEGLAVENADADKADPPED
jgi:hypothetical protein